MKREAEEGAKIVAKSGEKEAVEPVFVNRSMEPAISRKNQQIMTSI